MSDEAQMRKEAGPLTEEAEAAWKKYLGTLEIPAQAIKGMQPALHVVMVDSRGRVWLITSVPVEAEPGPFPVIK